MIPNDDLFKEIVLRSWGLLKDEPKEEEELKKKNNQLRETLYLLSRRLYTLEVRNIFFIFLFRVKMKGQEKMKK